VTRQELDQKIERTRAENRAALERADAFIRWFDREAPIHTVTTALAFQRLREAAGLPVRYRGAAEMPSAASLQSKGMEAASPSA
jgi:hypothetical protein